MIKNIALIFATEREASPFLSVLKNKKITKTPYAEFYEGNFINKKIIIAVSGVGKIKAALTTNALKEKFFINYIINIGYAGLLNKDITEKGGILIAIDAVQYDFDLSAVDNCPVGYQQDVDSVFLACDTNVIKLMKKSNFDVAFGRVASGDKFLSDKHDSDSLRSTFNADACDMELASILFVSKLNQISVSSIKIISDVVGNEDNYYNTGNIIKKAIDITVFLLNNLD